jgi:hypothetical protein
MPSPEHQQAYSPKVETDQSPELSELLQLKEQYLAQVKVLYRSGLLENLLPTPDHPKPELGIIGINGQEYALPSYEDVVSRLQDPEKRAFFEKKAEQGFTKLLMVPFGLPLNTIIERYRAILLKTHKESGIKATDGSTLDLDEDDPLYVLDELKQSDNPNTPKNKQMEYYVKTYDGTTKEQRGGQYKSEILKDNPDNAWQILLVEDLPDLPAPGQGQTIKGRKQIEANESPQDYLKALKTNPQYQGEQGLTSEANLILWLTHLQENQTAIDDWQGQGEANLLTGQYLSGYVPYFIWCRDVRRPFLNWSDLDYSVSYYGFRSAVSVYDGNDLSQPPSMRHRQSDSLRTGQKKSE